MADVDRSEEWAASGRLGVGYAVLIDEGIAYRRRPICGDWREWPKAKTGYEAVVAVFRAAAAADD